MSLIEGLFLQGLSLLSILILKAGYMIFWWEGKQDSFG